MKKVLITGIKGFLGRNIAKHFSQLGYETYGVGHGTITRKECEAIGLKYWSESEITIGTLKGLNQKFDLIFHCGGSGSVGFSIENPYEDFKKTVDGTLEVLEYMRLYNADAQLIYPSSPAVQGEHPDSPIKEEYVGKPTSPYGYHKKIAEDLCRSYSEKYNLSVKIIRLFSVYGDGLKKQLLWDAYRKLLHCHHKAEFWGTGTETRDFIHIHDVLSLIDIVIAQQERLIIINGASGIKYTVAEVIDLIKKNLYSLCETNFNNQVNIGNPIYYWADMTKSNALNWTPKISFDEGVKSYVKWAKNV